MIAGKEILVILLSYIIGCISTGYYVTYFCTGKDIREYMSGSTGARNVGRKLGQKGFIITLLGDFLKGSIAMGIAFALKLQPLGIMLTLLAVVMGHIWPAQLHFHGGKGIAVTFGALAVFDYWLAMVLVLAFGLIFLCSKRYMLSGLIAFGILPVTSLFLGHSKLDMIAIIILVLMLIFAHRANIRELYQKT